MKDLVRRMLEDYEFPDDVLSMPELGKKILDSSNLREAVQPLLFAMGETRKLLDELDALRPPLAAPTPEEEPSVSDSPAITPARIEDVDMEGDEDEDDEVEESKCEFHLLWNSC
jgi:hypothetical protein